MIQIPPRTSCQYIIQKVGKRNGTITQITILAVATLLAADNGDRFDVAIINGGTQTVFLGEDVGVTILNGFPLLRGMGITFDAYTGPIYGIVAALTAVCGVIEV